MNTPLTSMLMFLIAALLGAVGQFLYKTGAEQASGALLRDLANARLLAGWQWGPVPGGLLSGVLLLSLLGMIVTAWRRLRHITHSLQEAAR